VSQQCLAILRFFPLIQGLIEIGISSNVGLFDRCSYRTHRNQD
jgi:hypothetical protein